MLQNLQKYWLKGLRYSGERKAIGVLRKVFPSDQSFSEGFSADEVTAPESSFRTELIVILSAAKNLLQSRIGI
ncbi:hypothetical protein GGQ60_000190 [Pedobacter zeae]|uniref:Uncharacterized protein n=1 Tax=Pedobacter zeae TaxID=1737356 RepID=A0A7W6K6S0_9SPHI|nr:hypothetical protein [Pedobacter zeae]